MRWFWVCYSDLKQLVWVLIGWFLLWCDLVFVFGFGELCFWLGWVIVSYLLSFGLCLGMINVLLEV